MSADPWHVDRLDLAGPLALPWRTFFRSCRLHGSSTPGNQAASAANAKEYSRMSAILPSTMWLMLAPLADTRVASPPLGVAVALQWATTLSPSAMSSSTSKRRSSVAER